MEATARAEPALDRLGRHGKFRVVTLAHLVSADPGHATVMAHGMALETVPADKVVFVGYKVPNAELDTKLRNAGMEVHCIGDARSGRDVQAAIHEGHLAGRAIA